MPEKNDLILDDAEVETNGETKMEADLKAKAEADAKTADVEVKALEAKEKTKKAEEAKKEAEVKARKEAEEKHKADFRKRAREATLAEVKAKMNKKKFNAVKVVDGKREVRRYTLAIHGKDFPKLADSFARKHNYGLAPVQAKPRITCPSCGHKFDA